VTASVQDRWFLNKKDVTHGRPSVYHRSLSVVPSYITGRVDIIQCAIDQQLANYRQLLNRQRQAAWRTFKLTGQIGSEDV
jgi:hypothetical protein